MGSRRNGGFCDNVKNRNKVCLFFNLNTLIVTKENESVIKTLPTNKYSGLDNVIGEFYQTFKDD